MGLIRGVATIVYILAQPDMLRYTVEAIGQPEGIYELFLNNVLINIFIQVSTFVLI